MSHSIMEIVGCIHVVSQTTDRRVSLVQWQHLPQCSQATQWSCCEKLGGCHIVHSFLFHSAFGVSLIFCWRFYQSKMCIFASSHPIIPSFGKMITVLCQLLHHPLSVMLHDHNPHFCDMLKTSGQQPAAALDLVCVLNYGITRLYNSWFEKWRLYTTTSQ